VRGAFLASNHVRSRRQAVRALLGQIAEHAELNVVTILVTGSAGHLGEALMRRLRAERRPVRGVDIKPSPFAGCVGSIGDRDLISASMRGVRTVIHAASLHKPHVATHSKRDFIDTNILGTLALLEEAVAAGVEAFIFASTTSAFGAALTPAAGAPAVWVTEEVAPIPRNIYGVTKVAAEGLCQLFFREHRLPVIVLRTSRFFPEADDDDAISASYEIANVQANELLYRRVDIEDVVGAHLLAVEKARNIGFARFIISAATPFGPGDLAGLNRNAPEVVHRLFPECAEIYGARGWRLFPRIERVYDSRRAMAELTWNPKYDFRHALQCLRAGIDFRSPLAREVGSKGYGP
jgi:UDP-glucose 4-epimerase